MQGYQVSLPQSLMPYTAPSKITVRVSGHSSCGHPAYCLGMDMVWYGMPLLWMTHGPSNDPYAPSNNYSYLLNILLTYSRWLLRCSCVWNSPHSPYSFPVQLETLLVIYKPEQLAKARGLQFFFLSDFCLLMPSGNIPNTQQPALEDTLTVEKTGTLTTLIDMVLKKHFSKAKANSKGRFHPLSNVLVHRRHSGYC